MLAGCETVKPEVLGVCRPCMLLIQRQVDWLAAVEWHKYPELFLSKPERQEGLIQGAKGQTLMIPNISKQTYLRHTASSFPDNYNKVSIAVKWVIWIFFLVHLKAVYTIAYYVCSIIMSKKLYIPYVKNTLPKTANHQLTKSGCHKPSSCKRCNICISQ